MSSQIRFQTGKCFSDCSTNSATCKHPLERESNRLYIHRREQQQCARGIAGEPGKLVDRFYKPQDGFLDTHVWQRPRKSNDGRQRSRAPECDQRRRLFPRKNQRGVDSVATITLPSKVGRQDFRVWRGRIPATRERLLSLPLRFSSL
jgi:hypothetical protein